LVQRAGLPTEAPPIGAARALELMRMDKKVRKGAVRLVLLEKPGRAVVTSNYREDALQATLIEHFS
jgi:3-dehydroquinate synthase